MRGASWQGRVADRWLLFALRSTVASGFFLACLGSAEATIWRVKPAGTGLGDSWETAATLRTALLLAEVGDEIWVAAGVHRPTTSADRTSTFQLRAGMAVYGGFAGTETSRQQRNWRVHLSILSGDLLGDDGPDFANYADNVYHVVTGAEGATLDGLIIEAGNSNGAVPNDRGAGLYNAGVSVTVSHCVFRWNLGAFGQGSAIHNLDGSDGAINSTSFVGNKAFYGGAVFNNSSSPPMVNCLFVGNLASSGAAVYGFKSSSALRHCTFVGNSATSGSALSAHSASALTVSNSIIWDPGPEVLLSASTVTFRHSNVRGSGGSGDWDQASGSDGGGNLDLEPGFADAGNPAGPDGVIASQDDGLRLAAGSPCADRGETSGAPALDILDLVRPQGPGLDLGAYERPIGGPTPSRTPTRTGTPTRTRTSTPTRTATVTATPTLRPGDPDVRFAASTTLPGRPVHALGSMPPGSYRLCVVPNGTYRRGSDEIPSPISCSNLVSQGGNIPLTLVWGAAALGQYDLLLLSQTAGQRILAGSDLEAGPGLVVASAVPGSSQALVVALLAAGIGLAAIRLGRQR